MKSLSCVPARNGESSIAQVPRSTRLSTVASRLRVDVPGKDLLALRALATQPLRRLAALDPQIAAAWRRGDPRAVETLAALELRGLGLRP